jgi:hypothetical protein
MVTAAKQVYRRISETKDGRIVCIAILAFIGILGLIIFRDYGISYDEYFEMQMVLWHRDYIIAGGHWREIESNLEFYGLFFNFISIIPYLLFNMIQTGGDFVQTYSAGMISGSLYHFKHLATFLFGLIAYVSAALFVKDLRGWKFAWLGIVLLALCPRFWGHSFFNPKDIPFAALFAATCWVGSRFTARVLEEGSARNNLSGNILSAMAFGGFAGMLTSVRVGGFVVVGYAPLALVILLIVSRQRWSVYRIVELSFLCCVVLLSWMGVSVLLNPVSWSSPAQWFAEAVTYHVNHKWDGYVLAFGKYWFGQDVPGYYLPAWFGITTPVLTLLSAVVGWIFSLFGLLKSNRRQQSIIVWLSLMAFGLPVVAILKSSTLYDAVRQFLFVLPAIAVFSALGLAWLWEKLPKGKWRIGFVAVVTLNYCAVIVDMVRLHPYEYVYFNNLVRAEGMEDKFEMDYWALSSREAMEWIESQLRPSKKVYHTTPTHTVESFAHSDTKLVTYTGRSRSEGIEGPVYYLCNPRNALKKRQHPRDRFPDWETVFQVERKLGWITLPLAIVKYGEQDSVTLVRDRARTERIRVNMERNRARSENSRVDEERNRALMERRRAHRDSIGAGLEQNRNRARVQRDRARAQRNRVRMERRRARRDSVRARMERRRARIDSVRTRLEWNRSQTE